MNDDRRRLIVHRLQRARDALDVGRLMLQEHHIHACVNRLYYACFYSVSALLRSQGLSSSRHSGVQALFNKHWVKPGLFPREAGRFYNTLFDARLEADYADMAEFTADEVSSWFDRA